MSKYSRLLDINERNSITTLLKRIKPNSTVLEFGPDEGVMTKYLYEVLNCKVYTVEVDKNSAEKVKQYSEFTLQDDIEKYNWKDSFKDIEFDYIIFADVLEHLYHPECVLSEVKKFLKYDGSILVSIPNIAHNSIIINLMKNEFNYNAVGLLDNTHIRFFTQKTFSQLIEQCGYYKCYETQIFKRPESTEFKNSYDMLPSDTANFLKINEFGEAYQLIYEIKKHGCELNDDYSIKYEDFTSRNIQLYIDNGEGFNEKDSIKIAYKKQNKVTFDISNYRTIQNLRLDPLNAYVALKINNIFINNTSVQTEMVINGLLNEQIYYFINNDPQINVLLDNYDNIKTISFEIEFLAEGIEAINMFNNFLTTELQQTKENLNQKNQELQQTKENLNQKNQELQQTKENLNQKSNELEQTNSELLKLQHELTFIYTGKSWNITRPLRKLKKILQGTK